MKLLKNKVYIYQKISKLTIFDHISYLLNHKTKVLNFLFYTKKNMIFIKLLHTDRTVSWLFSAAVASPTPSPNLCFSSYSSSSTLKKFTAPQSRKNHVFLRKWRKCIPIPRLWRLEGRKKMKLRAEKWDFLQFIKK